MTVKEDNMPRTSPASSATASPPASAPSPISPAVSAAAVAAVAAAVSANSRMAAAVGMLPGMLGASSAADRYITPEYLAPLPPSSGDKTGKSPLQLLAQTCSQIGADTGSKLDKTSNGENGSNKSKHNGNSRSPALIVSDPATTTTTLPPSIAKPVSFKPYEKDVTKMSPKAASISPHRSGSSSTSPKMSNGKSPSPHHHNNNNRMSPIKDKSGHTTTAAPKVSSAAVTSAAETTPQVRSGLEVLSGHHAKDSPFRMPPGAHDPTNPAFRPPFGAAHLPAGMGGFPAGGVCRDPYCRDPTCPTAVYNAQLASLGAAGGLSQSYLQMAAAAAAMHNTPTTSSAAISAAAAAVSTASGGPYICNWMNGREGYCGKRHSSAEELLQHLRTHTNLSTNDSSASAAAAALLSNPSAAAAAAAASLYPPNLLAAGLHRTGAYPSSLASSSRFHPYGKPGGPHSTAAPSLPPSLASLGALGMPPPGLPPSLAGLGAAAYSPSALYALYGSRLAGGP